MVYYVGSGWARRKMVISELRDWEFRDLTSILNQERGTYRQSVCGAPGMEPESPKHHLACPRACLRTQVGSEEFRITDGEISWANNSQV